MPEKCVEEESTSGGILKCATGIQGLDEITGERGAATLTRHGLEEYVSDCVILLDHRVAEQVSIRRLRIVKYRGSTHGTNEYPFLIDTTGMSVLPITSLGLTHAASSERISSGVEALDAMLGGQGYYRGSSVLVSGTGKTSLASGGGPLEQTEAGASSLMDTWLLLRSVELSGEHNRVLYLLKSRGMAHSNQVREFLLTDRGVRLCDVYTGPEGVLTGSARLVQVAREEAESLARSRQADGNEMTSG